MSHHDALGLPRSGDGGDTDAAHVRELYVAPNQRTADGGA